MEPSTKQVCEDLISLMQRLKRSIFSTAESLGLTPVQLFALYWIHKRGELAMGQMADVLYCDASNVTGLVDRLMAQGLVTRQESTRDRRIKTLRVTPKGEDIVERFFAALPAEINYHKLGPTEQQQLHRLLRQLSA